MESNTINSGEKGGKATYLAKNETGILFPRGQTALLVIDPVNDFLSEGGAAWEMTKTTVEKNDVVGNLKRVIEGARAQGIPVLFGPMAYTEEDYMDEKLQRRTGINRLMFEMKMFLAGSWGADFHPELQPKETDIILLPHKGTDVYQTDLPVHLQRMGITHLVIAGMTANLCCESTGRHAAEAGYDVTFISDAIGSEDIPSYEASIRINYPLIGNAVMTVDEFFASLEDSRSGDNQVQPGDTVHGSDDGEIGAVQEVVGVSAGEGEGYLLVPRGMIFTTDTYIPLSAVIKRSGTNVYINAPSLVVASMPWSEPPSRSETKAKFGPPADAVEKLYGSFEPTVFKKSAQSGD